MTLSSRQQKILEFIEGYLAEHHFPPTIREIGAAVGISSTSVVNYNLKKLEEGGYINRNPDVSRGIRILKPTRLLAVQPGQSTTIRLLGRIAAGEPIPVPDQNPFGGEAIELADLLVSDVENVYALEVQGDSMIDALVADGDLVILRYQQTAHNGDMVAAWLKDREETTLKYFYLEGDRVRLQPANPNYQPIYVPPQQVEIQGKVIAIVRRLA
ncbi:MAG: transcriptional repressor LexA [Anaerolineae bacterium]|nr:transcriptional repressor LexA [Anaerolineae bacterium]MDW8100743.1 transcriptional repressor LexA [Anaerolineae bacterium]